MDSEFLTPYHNYCKIGTQPEIVRIHGADRVEVGRTIRVQTAHSKWFRVKVRKVEPNGYFFADHQ